MSKKIVLLLLLIIIVICGMGCGEGIRRPGGLSGTVFLGGEPDTTLPDPGISSLAFPLAPVKRAALNGSLPAKPTSLIVTCDAKLSKSEQIQSLKHLGFEIIRQLYNDSNTYVVKPINKNNLEVSYQASATAGFIRSVEYNFPLTKMATTPMILIIKPGSGI